ncbi:hypothetical protein DAERI_010346 [Deinococcus aerius]|uniref:Uncharacterized protein n=1 Tax=Deinococcus aerius TaxID=200253 RepID=A0A2I9CRL7_9DEIO|nr:hypothetical protein [Deinococcus aerius]GBF04174.1 hypothetical protein DAERI_010346 [Deinococcus aerius]
MPEEAGRGRGVVLTAIYAGVINTAETFLLRLKDGRLLRPGLFGVPDVREGKALLVRYGEVPLSDPPNAFLGGPSQVTGEATDTRKDRTLTRNFPTPNRPGAGNSGPCPLPATCSNSA